MGERLAEFGKVADATFNLFLDYIKQITKELMVKLLIFTFTGIYFVLESFEQTANVTTYCKKTKSNQNEKTNDSRSTTFWYVHTAAFKPAGTQLPLISWLGNARPWIQSEVLEHLCWRNLSAELLAVIETPCSSPARCSISHLPHYWQNN